MNNIASQKTSTFGQPNKQLEVIFTPSFDINDNDTYDFNNRVVDSYYSKALDEKYDSNHYTDGIDEWERDSDVINHSPSNLRDTIKLQHESNPTFDQDRRPVDFSINKINDDNDHSNIAANESYVRESPQKQIVNNEFKTNWNYIYFEKNNFDYLDPKEQFALIEKENNSPSGFQNKESTRYDWLKCTDDEEVEVFNSNSIGKLFY